MKTEAEGREGREGQERRDRKSLSKKSKKWFPAITTAACVLATLTVAAQAPRTVVLRAADTAGLIMKKTEPSIQVA